MGSMIHLTFGRIHLDWGKNSGFQDHSALFRPCDLTEIPYYYAAEEEPERAHLPLIKSSNGFSYRLITEMKEGYAAPVSTVARRLLLLGYTEEFCRREFEALREIGYANHDFEFDELKSILTEADFSEAAIAGGRGSIDIVEFLAEHILPARGDGWERRLHTGLSDTDGIYGLSTYSIIRLLSANPTARELPVTWQFADVAEGGWAPREHFAAPIRQTNRFLVVTEGSSDVQIIRHALALLTPDLADFFDFVDMRENYPFLGTGNLYNFVRGLISIHIQNNIVVIFDNDAEGFFNWERSTKLNNLENMRIVRLPDRQQFRAFRTAGPTGEFLADINGKAAAIECYLDVGPAPIVRWTNYDQRRDCYQGHIIGKEEFTKAFLAQTSIVPSYDYSGLEAILAMLLQECASISEAEAFNVLAAELPRD